MPLSADLIWLIVSFVLTVCIFSYLFGDNPLFRLATGLLIGVTAGYLAVTIIYQVLLPKLVVPLLQGSLTVLIPLFLSGLLLTKLSPRLSRLGNFSMAYLVACGAAIAIGGALLGTLFTQVKGAMNSMAPASTASVDQKWTLILEGGFILLGTIASLAYFNFGTRENKNKTGKRPPMVRLFSAVGQFFIAVTLGAVFAGVLTSTITALIERSDFLFTAIKTFFGLG
jgi:heme/copper-type cytochrome/quinol oxidase subunit 2